MRLLKTSLFTAVCAVVVAGLATGPATASSPSTYRLQQLCAAAKPGQRSCFAVKVVPTGAAAHASVSPAAVPSGYGPSDLTSAYNLPASGGSGVTVAIVDAYNDPTAESDLASYRSTYGLPACTTANGCFSKVSQTGSATSLPSTNTGWAGEIALDIEMVSAGCPSCHILLVEASSASDANLDTAVDYAAAHAQVVSNSYGGSESSTDTSDLSHYNHSGVTMLASSGDEGYVVEFPAASPSVVAVGGTALTKTTTTSRGWTEKVWNTSNSEGAGSGCSKYETKPTWQTDTGCSKRTVADVSAVADPATGVAVYDTTGGSGWAVYGGTSVASPLVAAIVSKTGHAGISASYLYAHPSFFYDVTSGQTATSCTSYLCKAGTGYDGPTGLGTPNGGLLAGGQTTNDFSLSASSASVVAGASGTATISTATTAGSAQSVALTASGAPAGSTVSFNPTSVTSGSSSTATITVPAGTSAGTYSVTVTGSAASGSHTATLALTVTSSGGTNCTGQKLLNPGFESGAASWSASSGVINTDGAHAHAGSGYAWLDGYGTAHTDTLSQTATIPAGCATTTFSFWLYITTSETTTTTAYDKLTVSAGGTTVATYSNLNKSSGYVQKSFTLSGYAGKSLAISFNGVEDSSLQTSFFIDDTSVTAA